MSQQVLTFAGSPLSGAVMIAALESKLQSLASSRSGTSRPSDIQPGEEWLDTTTATAWAVKRWDGTDDITSMTYNTTTNTVSFTGLVIGTDVQAYDSDTMKSDTYRLRTRSHPSTKLALTDNSLTIDLESAEVFDWTPTGAATLNAPTIPGGGTWAIRYNYTSGPTLPKVPYDGSAWVATGDLLLIIGFATGDYELIWLNKA